MTKTLISLNWQIFLLFFFGVFVLFYFPIANNNRVQQSTDKYHLTSFLGEPGETGIENTIYIKNEHKYVNQNEYKAKPNCIFQVGAEKYSYVVGSDEIPEMLEYVFFWGESEINRMNLDPRPFNCTTWCSHGAKFWFNKYSTATIYEIPRFPTQLINQLQASDVKKERDVLVMLTNCEPNRLNYLNTWINKIQKEMPNVTISLCGRCFGNKIHPECPPRTKLFEFDQLLWIKKHRFVVAMENSVCDNYATEKIFLPIYSQTIPIIYTASSLPYWLSDFLENRFLTTENFFTQFSKLKSEQNYNKMLIDSYHFDQIISKIPANFDKICSWITDCEKNKAICYKKIRQETDKKFAQCLTDCKSSFGCHQNFSIPSEWKKYQL